MGLTNLAVEVQLLGVGIGVVLILAATLYRVLFGVGMLIVAAALSPEIGLAGIPVRVQDLMIPVVFLIWGLRHVSQRRRAKPTRLLVPYLCFLFIMATATVHSFIVQENVQTVQATFHFLKHVQYGLLFFLVLNVVESRKDIALLAYAVILGATISAAQAAANPIGYEGRLPRLQGIVTEGANIYGGFLMFVALMTIGFFLEEERFGTRVVLGLAVLIMLYPMTLTLSRSTYVAFLAGLVFLGFMREPKILLVLTIAPFLVAPFLPEEIIDRMSTIIYAITDVRLVSAWQARLEAWAIYLPEIARYPLIGRGLFHVPMGEIDNELVLRGVETGLLGVGTFLWFFGMLADRAVRGWLISDHRIDRQVHLGYLAALTGLSVHSLAATSFTAIRTAEPLYFTSGLVVASYLLILDVEPEDDLEVLRHREFRRRHESRQKNFQVRSIPLNPGGQSDDKNRTSRDVPLQPD